MTIEYCADVIAFLGEKLVLIERLSNPCGFALPGGHVENHESLTECAHREFHEETGLTLSISEVWATYADPERDPRGHKVSTVFIGQAQGTPRNEVSKTKVLLVPRKEVLSQLHLFVFDHGEILRSYLESL